MPLTGTDQIFGAVLAAAAGSLDPVGILKWGGISGTMATWIPLHTLVDPTPPGGTLTASAGVITGYARLTFISKSTFGEQLAAAAGSVDEVGKQKWANIGAVILKHFEDYAHANPTALIAPSGGGAVSGTGTVSFTSTSIGLNLANAAGSIDLIGTIAWEALGMATLNWFSTNATFRPTPIGMVAPASGFVTGSGTII
jgi:hypothetical protein